MIWPKSAIFFYIFQRFMALNQITLITLTKGTFVALDFSFKVVKFHELVLARRLNCRPRPCEVRACAENHSFVSEVQLRFHEIHASKRWMDAVRRLRTGNLCIDHKDIGLMLWTDPMKKHVSKLAFDCSIPVCRRQWPRPRRKPLRLVSIIS